MESDENPAPGPSKVKKVTGKAKTEKTTAVKNKAKPEKAAAVKDKTKTEKAAVVKEKAKTPRAAAVKDKAKTTEKAAAVKDKGKTEKAAEVKDKTKPEKAAPIKDKAKPEKAAAVKDKAKPEKAAAVKGKAKTEKAAVVKDKAKTEKATSIKDKEKTNAEKTTAKDKAKANAVKTPKVKDAEKKVNPEEKSEKALPSTSTKKSTFSLVAEAIAAVGHSKKGASAVAIRKYVQGKSELGGKKLLNTLINKALAKGIQEGAFARPHGMSAASGATGSFLLAKQKKKAGKVDNEKYLSDSEATPKKIKPRRKRNLSDSVVAEIKEEREHDGTFTKQITTEDSEVEDPNQPDDSEEDKSNDNDEGNSDDNSDDNDEGNSDDNDEAYSDDNGEGNSDDRDEGKPDDSDENMSGDSNDDDFKIISKAKNQRKRRSESDAEIRPLEEENDEANPKPGVTKDAAAKKRKLHGRK